MERIYYQHPVYKNFGLKDYPPVYLARSLGEITDFEQGAIGTMQLVEEEARRAATGLVGLVVRISETLPIRMLRKTGGGRRVEPYYCYFGIRDIQHWPAYDPKDERLVSVRDQAGSTLVIGKPTRSDIETYSPFPDSGCYFDWEAVRGVSWRSNIAIRARYDPGEGAIPDYALVYITDADEKNRRGGRRRPVNLVTVRGRVAAGIQI